MTRETQDQRLSRYDELGKRILDYLSDGAWHPLGVTLRALAVHVQPGQAARRAESERLRVARYHNRNREVEKATERLRERDAQDIVTIGATAIIRKRLTDMRRYGIVEITPGRKREEKQVRLIWRGESEQE